MTVQLGLAVPGPVGSSGANSWDLRDSTLEGERLAEAINNTLQHMWRATRQARLSLDNPVVRRIDGAMSRWEPFWAAFKDALLERQFDFGLGLWGTDWGEELRSWQARIITLDEELKTLLAQQVRAGEASADQARAYAQGLQDRGVDTTLDTFKAEVKRDNRPTGFVLALVGVGALIGAGLYLGRRRRRR